MNYEYILKALNQAIDNINKANDKAMPEEMQEQLDKMTDDIYWIMSELEDMEKENTK